MSDERLRISFLKRRWDEEDATRDDRERQAQRAFLEQEADQLFGPVEDYLSKLGRILEATTDASVEVEPNWEHLGERKLRRVAKVKLRTPAQEFYLDFTIEGVTIFYCNTPYRFTRSVETLIPVITSAVEQFINAQNQAAGAPKEL